MSNSSAPTSTSQGLAFLALLSFVAAFSAARIFTTINPDAVVVSSGIHFHHFWYGLLMVVVAGWLAIVSNRPEYDRAYAVTFGLGLGLIGDETGLLLTLGDYHSELTYVIFVAGVSLVAMGLLAARYWSLLMDEVVRLGSGERSVHLGIGICAVSFLAFAFDQLLAGGLVLVLGLAVTATGVLLHRKMQAVRD
ncbi:MAG TPA: hypothetical protein VKF15_08025 [Nitrososphaerales archaeon]|nr:hypothetical protein [Nitrososphaerales archaeon]